MSQTLYDKYKFGTDPLTRNFDEEILQQVVENKNSASNWQITYPQLEELREILSSVAANIEADENPEIGLVLYYTFQRDEPPGTSDQVKDIPRIINNKTEYYFFGKDGL